MEIAAMAPRRGRPPKVDTERLCPISTSVSPRVYAALQRIAAARELPVAEVVRRIISGRLDAPVPDVSQLNN